MKAALLISLAATPCGSAHESGLARDTSDHGTWRPWLEAVGYAWMGDDDPVHFTYTGGGSRELAGEDVRAFQLLWNLHNPADPVAEDGAFNAETEVRLNGAPAAGFPEPPACE